MDGCRLGRSKDEEHDEHVLRLFSSIRASLGLVIASWINCCRSSSFHSTGAIEYDDGGGGSCFDGQLSVRSVEDNPPQQQLLLVVVVVEVLASNLLEDWLSSAIDVICKLLKIEGNQVRIRII